jgi:hypothetical protein
MFQSPYSFVVENASLFHIQSILTYCWSTLATTLIITLGLFMGTQLSGYHPQNLKLPVNRTSCTCDCWDGFFRGIHPRDGYKTFYINYELQTIVLMGLFLFYAELLRSFLVKLISRRRIVTLLLLPAIYSNFYGTWNLINYLNDHDYHKLLPSQIYFSITELVTNYIFYRCLLRTKTDTPIPQWCIYLVATICSIHVLLAVGELNIQLVLRNIALLVPDLISLTWVTILIARDHELRPDRRYACIWLFISLFILMFYYIVCPFRENK